MKKVLYEELLPEEFVQRMQEMPVAYLPLGTLEWHGPHMPLGADGIQSKELFVRVAEKVGGVVLPILFMGPDRVFHDHEKSFYGMDINTEGALHTYYVQQLKGSAYWLEKELFQDYLRSIFCPAFQSGGAYCRRTWTWTVNPCISGTDRRSRRKIWSAYFYGLDICGR